MITKQKVNIVNLDNRKVEQGNMRSMGNRERTGERKDRNTNISHSRESKDAV